MSTAPDRDDTSPSVFSPKRNEAFILKEGANMATPTPMKHAPSQQGRTPSQSQHGAAATPAASTPFSITQGQAAFSPHGPRSSPQQVKKSPANSQTLLGHPGSAPVSFDSPSAAAALGALGISGGIDLGLDNVSIGELGQLGSLGRGDEDERAKRLQAVIDLMKQSRGIVSEAGLERLARTTGLEYLWDEGMGGIKTRTLIIAGSALALDIVLSNNIAEQVSVAFPEASDTVTRHADSVAQILLKDLKLLPHESPLCKKLDKFAANLERLAVLDKLSVVPKLNCYEAIAGIYESIERLHKWDLEKLRQDPAMAGKDEEYLQTAATCTRNGRPRMNEGDRVGLGLDYWTEKRLSSSTSQETKAWVARSERTWSLMISCAPQEGGVYPPVRVSDKWISTNIEHPLGGMLDWQEPEDIILSDNETKGDAGPDAMQTDGPLSGPKFPEVIFMATFDPPVNVPYNVWEQVYNETQAPPSSEFSLATFDSLIFPISPGTNHDPSEPRTVRLERKVPFVDRSGETSVETHQNSLFIYKPVYGRTLTEVPFFHPQQLIAMLPLLRQYAFLSTLLEASFGAEVEPVLGAVEDGDKTITTARDDFSNFMVYITAGGSKKPADAPAGISVPQEPALTIDVTLTAHPVPRLQVVFPFRQGTANILLEIRLNGEVYVVSENILRPETQDDGAEVAGTENSKSKAKALEPQHLGRALEMFENIGKWCEWIRSRLG